MDPWSDAIAGLALALSIFALVRGEQRSRRDERRRTRLGPADEIRAAVIRARKLFQDLIAEGGKRMDFFLDGENQDAGQTLEDLADQM